MLPLFPVGAGCGHVCGEIPPCERALFMCVCKNLLHLPIVVKCQIHHHVSHLGSKLNGKSRSWFLLVLPELFRACAQKFETKGHG